MLKLHTPLTIGTHTYTALIPGKGEWDLRARRIVFQLTPVEEEATALRVAQEVPKDKGYRVLNPPAVLSLTIQDSEDPAINAVIQQFTSALEALEQFIQDQLADQVYEFGEDAFPLAATFEMSAKEYRNKRLPQAAEPTLPPPAQNPERP